MKFQTRDRWAVVTGASAGIGMEIARNLANRGCNLVIVARRLDRLVNLQKELEQKNIKCHPMARDLTEPGAADNLAESLSTYDISIVVNNAGFALTGPFEEYDAKTLANMLGLNITFLTSFTHAMLPRLIKRNDGARIMNVGSIAGYQGVPGMATYAATKAFVNNFTEGLNWELRGTGVAVTCLQPGSTASEFFEVADMEGAKMSRYAMTPESVAKQGVKAMIAGKPKIVTGLTNKLLVFSLRLSPRFLVGHVITWLFRDLREKKS